MCLCGKTITHNATCSSPTLGYVWSKYPINLPELMCFKLCSSYQPHRSPLGSLQDCLLDFKTKLGIATKSHRLSDMRLSRHPLIIATASSLVLIKKLLSSYRPCRTQLPGFQPELITVLFKLDCFH